MATNRLGRSTYHKSPGRYNGPAVLERESGKLPRTGTLAGEQQEEAVRSRRTSALLTQQPDLRKARQIQRQTILANKFRPMDVNVDSDEVIETEEVDFSYPPRTSHLYREDDPNIFIENEQSAFEHSFSPAQRGRAYVEEELWDEPAYDVRSREEEVDLPQNPQTGAPLAYGAPGRRVQPEPERLAPVARRRSAPAAYDEDAYEYADDEEAEEVEQEQAPQKTRRKKKRFTRRKLLFGLGLVAVGGTAAAAYELGPKLPGAISQVGTNLEHQIQDAYNRGLAAGAEAVRKDFVNSLNTLEGYSLASAISAARLTRQAYDTFVSPIVTAAATVTGDFLNIALRAVVIARGWLMGIGQDNATMASLQTILGAWVKQVNGMPQALQSITDADLDGAQAYLRALQRKLQAEQAQLNQTQRASTPSPAPTKMPKH